MEKRQICNKNTRYSGFESFWILSIGKYFKLGKPFFTEFISNFPIFDRNKIFRKSDVSGRLPDGETASESQPQRAIVPDLNLLSVVFAPNQMISPDRFYALVQYRYALQNAWQGNSSLRDQSVG
jgi:hypothetical protein